jgi:hypothetical protein
LLKKRILRQRNIHLRKLIIQKRIIVKFIHRLILITPPLTLFQKFSLLYRPFVQTFFSSQTILKSAFRNRL